MWPHPHPRKQNLTLIRSGQDWSSTTPSERTLYLTTLHPTLTKGMAYLRDHGDQVGCYSCRFIGRAGPGDTTAESRPYLWFGVF